ncbi:MAG: hypothetical protein AAFX81_16645 [Pseudomonadota bacterium]
MSYHLTFAMLLAGVVAACQPLASDTGTRPASTTTPPPVAPVLAGRAPANEAEQRCVDSLTRQMGGSVSVLSYEFAEPESQVRLAVVGDEASWNCLVANDGSTVKLSYRARD